MLGKFQELVRQMSPEQLQQARRILEEMIRDAGESAQIERRPTGSERRRHQRFSVNLKGNLRPLTPGVKQGQEKMIPITILDVSREGLRFVVNTADALYPIAEITFNAPNGRIRSLYCRIVRTRLIHAVNGDSDSPVRATEVAARAIDAGELAIAQQRHRELVAATKRIPAPERLPLVLVGGEQNDRGMYEEILQRKGHPLTITNSIETVPAFVESSGPQAVIYTNAGSLLMHSHIIEQVLDKCAEAAQIGVIQSNDDRKALLELGIDECVHAMNARSLLTMYIDRAVKSRIISSVPGQMQQQVLLILAEENLALAQLGSRLNGDSFQPVFAHDIDGFLARLRCTEVDAAVIDHGPASADAWKLIGDIHKEMPHLPMIVAVNDPRVGSEAILAGAADYLAMPFTVRNATQLITAALQVAECEMVVDTPFAETIGAA